VMERLADPAVRADFDDLVHEVRTVLANLSEKLAVPVVPHLPGDLDALVEQELTAASTERIQLEMRALQQRLAGQGLSFDRQAFCELCAHEELAPDVCERLADGLHDLGLAERPSGQSFLELKVPTESGRLAGAFQAAPSRPLHRAPRVRMPPRALGSRAVAKKDLVMNVAAVPGSSPRNLVAQPDAAEEVLAKNVAAVQGSSPKDLQAQRENAENLLQYADPIIADLPVTKTLVRLRRDLDLLDFRAGQKLRLSTEESLLLGLSVLTAFASPALVSMKVCELLIPSCAAIVATVSVSSEYLGKTEVANAKEIAAVSLKAAAEAEEILSNAERAKAILPLCVGLSATASAFALLVPLLLEEIALALGMPSLPVQASAVFLVMPVISVLSAAVGALAEQETETLCSRAVGLGNRRFANANAVGQSWKSQNELILDGASRLQNKWTSFALNTLPAPLIALVIPGPISSKATAAAALAACQAALSLTQAEYHIARAVDAVAVKARTAAVADTYANQAARVGAILPFTSALSTLALAATVFVVEVQPFVATVFPLLGSLAAAAASVSKTAAEADAAAASVTVEVLGGFSDDTFKEGPILNVRRKLRLVLKAGWAAIRNMLKRAFHGNDGATRRAAA